jgi:hypothetical protein
MQFQVPQFIETEDKVVGPFSIRQFLYVGVAGVISGILYFILQTWLFAIFAFVLVGGALAISFIKVGGRPLVNVIMSAAHFYWNPQTYVWKPDHPVIAAREPVREKTGGLPLEDIASGMALRKKWETEKKDGGGESALHKAWASIQNGGVPDAAKTSDRQFLEKKMAERYHIFQRNAGDREAARRVDYR